MLFHILKMLALTTIRKLRDSSNNFVLVPGTSSTWASMGHKNGETTQVFKLKFNKRQQANRIVNQDVNLFHSSIRHLRIRSEKTTYKTDKWTKYSAQRKYNFMLVNKLRAGFYTQLYTVYTASATVRKSWT